MVGLEKLVPGFQRGWKVGLVGLLGAGVASPLPAWALCPADLPAAVEAIAARPELARARLGMQVETLAGETIYSREGDRFFVPASTLKLLTTAAVLTALGPEFTLQTTIYGTPDDAGVAQLRVVGQGDPSFSYEDIDTLVAQLAVQGVRQVSVLEGDDGAFQGDAVNANWEWEDVQAGYGAPANALILAENELGLSLFPQAVGEPLRVVWDQPAQAQGWQIENASSTVPAGEAEFVSVGRDLGRPVLRVMGQLAAGAAPETAAIALPNPGEAFLQALQAALEQQNISVGQSRLLLGSPETPWPELATVGSPTLAELLVPTNQASNNLYAEALLKQLGRSFEGADTTQVSLAIAAHILGTLGVDPAAVVMVDGSGLARKNLVTPVAMVDVLQAMAQSPHASVYRQSLAVAGVSGTLGNRLRDTPAAGRLWGKSGAISRNFALAGYLERPEEPAIAFSIFLNNINQRGSVARQLIDELVLLLVELKSC